MKLKSIFNNLSSSKQRLYIIVTGCFIVMIILLFYSYLAVDKVKNSRQIMSDKTSIVINEVCNKNTSFVNGNGRTLDIIELYNRGNEPVTLNGWHFYYEDDWHLIPDVVINPGQFLSLFCSVDSADFFVYDVNVHFKISSRNAISLLDSNNKLVDKVRVPSLTENRSWARVYDGGDSWTDMEMTIGKSNQEAIVNVIKPDFSIASGFYDENFDLKISSNDGHEIYYSLDNSSPTINSLLYSEPIKIINNDNKAMVVRAVSVDQNGNYSEVATQIYFIDNENVFESDIISIVADPNDLYDETIGIFTNFNQRGQERRAMFSYFDINRELIMEQEAGIRVHGGEASGSRGEEIKSLLVKARKGYTGSDYFQTTFFPDSYPTNAIILRHRDPAYFNGFLQSLVADRNLSIQNHKLIKFFLNGEFYGEHAITEKQDDEYFAHNFGISTDNIIAVKSLYTGEYDLQAGKWVNAFLYDELVNFIWHTDFSLTENYEKLIELVDIKSLIDFYCSSIYLADGDVSPLIQNSLVWRTITPVDNQYGDGKWRFAFNDLDEACDWRHGGSYEANMFTGNWHIGRGHMALLNALLRNEDFKKLFKSTFLYLADNNFASDKVIDKLHREFGSNTVIEEFFSHRRDYAIVQLNDYLENFEVYESELTDVYITGSSKLENAYFFNNNELENVLEDEARSGITSYVDLAIIGLAAMAFLAFFICLWISDARRNKIHDKRKMAK